MLNIVAAGATQDESGNYQASADGSAVVNGNILVDGINLVLAGIYQSLEKRTEVRNATLTVVGTTQDDTVNVKALDGSGDIKVETGEGDDIP